MAAAFWTGGGLSHTIGDYRTEQTSINFLSQYTRSIEPKCGLNEIGNIFDHFTNDSDRAPGTATVSVDIIAIGNEMINTFEDIVNTRPTSDVPIVIIPDRSNPTLNLQSAVLGCGDMNSQCDNVFTMSDSISSSDLSRLIQTEACMERIYQSTINCSEYSMKIAIPSCALKGLEIWEISLKENILCDVKIDYNSTHYIWEVDYKDCGTTKTVNDKISTFSNELSTIINYSGENAHMPMFKIPVECQVHSDNEFEFNGDFELTVDHLTSTIEQNNKLTGNLRMFLNDDFTNDMAGPVEYGVPIFAQSELTTNHMRTQLEIVTCVAAPGPIDQMLPVDPLLPYWEFISDGCILDETLKIMEPGPNNELRFTFLSFNFRLDTSRVYIQCHYQTCEENCIGIKQCHHD